MQSTTKLIKHNKALLIIWTTGRTFDLSLITELSGVKRKDPVLGELQTNKNILEGRSHFWTILFIDRLNYT